MNYTQIKRLFQNQTEFVPITLAEAVVVNTSNIPGLVNLGITTLDKVLRNTLGLIGTNVQNIETLGSNITSLAGVVQTINTELQKKQDTLTPGVGISIQYNAETEQTVISATHTLEIYRIVTAEQWATIKNTPAQEYENIIYLVPQPQSTSVSNNVFKEFLCVFKNHTYQWEEFGTIQTDVDLSGYVTTQEFQTLTSNVNNLRATGVFAETVETSSGDPVVVKYTIPNDLYDTAVEQIDIDEIVTPGDDSGENPNEG